MLSSCGNKKRFSLEKTGDSLLLFKSEDTLSKILLPSFFFPKSSPVLGRGRIWVGEGLSPISSPFLWEGEDIGGGGRKSSFIGSLSSALSSKYACFYFSYFVPNFPYFLLRGHLLLSKNLTFLFPVDT